MDQQCQAESFHGFIPCSLKSKHHYWPGLLLVFHFVLLLVFDSNLQEDYMLMILMKSGCGSVVEFTQTGM